MLTRLTAATLLALLPVTACLADGEDETITVDPIISKALLASNADVRLYNEHLTFLASPFLGGRLPGTQGMDIAMDYVEHYLKLAGLEPLQLDAEGQPSYRQDFPLGGSTNVTAAGLSAKSRGTSMDFTADEDFAVTGMGQSGQVTGKAVFVGYSIDNGNDEYSSFDDADDLSGKVALMLRFEPMNDEGKSLWSNRARWTSKANFENKLRSIKSRNPAAVVIINTPGADDARSNDLVDVNTGGRQDLDVPVLSMTPEAADRLIQAADPEGRSLMDLRKLADAGRAIVDLDADVTVEAQLSRESLMAQNVAGIIRGKGSLADEFILIGAHLDHLGMGYFGSRSGPGQLHPGADDNASGSAGIMLIADWLSQQYSQLPDDADARSVIIMAFSGEESGLNGSRHYVNNPVVPLEKTYLMMNFDMIGRLQNGRLSVSGGTTADGFSEWLQQFYEDTPLTVVEGQSAGGGSDHLPFFQKKIPILFGICADFHQDYHTPQDIEEKINREAAVLSAKLFSDIAFAAAQRTEPLVFSSDSAAAQPSGPSMGDIKVRVGIMPGSYDENAKGILVGGVTPGTSADEAGVKDGDKFVTWNGTEIGSVAEWMGMLVDHSPGDVVELGVERDGKVITLKMTLKPRN